MDPGFLISDSRPETWKEIFTCVYIILRNVLLFVFAFLLLIIFGFKVSAQKFCEIKLSFKVLYLKCFYYTTHNLVSPPPKKKYNVKKTNAEHYFCVGTDGSVWFSCISEFSSLRIFRLDFILIIHSVLNCLQRLRNQDEKKSRL